jgi:DNA-binding NtrC family response regulator
MIYAVDDVFWLTQLYTLVLEAAGCRVEAFNDRAEALTALKENRTKPDLLITDDLGHTMPVEQFMQHCRVVHPSLRILMASGYSRMNARFSQARPDRFLQKPFTPDELQREVRATLTG